MPVSRAHADKELLHFILCFGDGERKMGRGPSGLTKKRSKGNKQTSGSAEEGFLPSFSPFLSPFFFLGWGHGLREKIVLTSRLFLASHPFSCTLNSFRSLVALKIFKSPQHATSAQYEFFISKRFSHPNIVRVLDW